MKHVQDILYQMCSMGLSTNIIKTPSVPEHVPPMQDAYYPVSNVFYSAKENCTSSHHKSINQLL